MKTREARIEEIKENDMEIKLSEFAKNYELAGCEDPIKIISEYIIESNRESDALTIIPTLAKARLDKIQSQLDYARVWIPNKCDLQKCNKGITAEQAKMLERLIDMYCLGLGLSEMSVEEARDVISNMKRPAIVFAPMVEWLRDKYGICFAEDEK